MNNKNRVKWISGVLIVIIIVIVAFFISSQETAEPRPEAPDISNIDTTGWFENNVNLLEKTLTDIEKNPEDERAWRNLGGLYRSAQEYDKAIEALKYADALLPNDTVTIMNLGGAYYVSGQYDKAEEQYRKVINNNPVWIAAYSQLLEIYRYQTPEKLPELIELTEIGRSVDLGDQYEDQFLKINGTVYYLTEDTSNALDTYRQYLLRNPDDKAIIERYQEIGGHVEDLNLDN